MTWGNEFLTWPCELVRKSKACMMHDSSRMNGKMESTDCDEMKKIFKRPFLSKLLVLTAQSLLDFSSWLQLSKTIFFFLLGRDVTLKYITNKHLSKLYYLRLYSRHWLLLSDFLCEGALHTELLPRWVDLWSALRLCFGRKEAVGRKERHFLYWTLSSWPGCSKAG